MANILIANIIKYIHFGLILFILIAHSLIPVKYIKYYLLLVMIIFLDWNDADGQCILTRLEHYFRTDKWKQSSPVEGGPEFFRPVINKLFNKQLSRTEADRLNNFIFIICWLIAFLRIYNKLN